MKIAERLLVQSWVAERIADDVSEFWNQEVSEVTELFHVVATSVVKEDPEGVDETWPVSRLAVASRHL